MNLISQATFKGTMFHLLTEIKTNIVVVELADIKVIQKVQNNCFFCQKSIYINIENISSITIKNAILKLKIPIFLTLGYHQVYFNNKIVHYHYCHGIIKIFLPHIKSNSHNNVKILLIRNSCNIHWNDVTLTSILYFQNQALHSNKIILFNSFT